MKKNLTLVAILTALTACTSTIGIRPASIRERVLGHYNSLISPLDFAEAMHSEEADDEWSTTAESEFEESHPNLNLFGPPENLQRSTLEDLTEWLSVLPQETLSKYNYDLVLAYETPRSQAIVDFGILEEGGHCDTEDKVISVFSHSKNVFIHEFMHAFHLTDPDVKDRINEEWENIEVTIDGSTKKLKDIYSDSNLLGPKEMYDRLSLKWNDGKSGPRWGFARPYGANNINEDVAAMGEAIYKEVVADSYESFLIMDLKAKILLREKFITRDAYDLWKVKNLKKVKPTVADEHYWNDIEKYLAHPAKKIRDILQHNPPNAIPNDLLRRLVLSELEEVSDNAKEVLIKRQKDKALQRENLEFFANQLNNNHKYIRTAAENLVEIAILRKTIVSSYEIFKDIVSKIGKFKIGKDTKDLRYSLKINDINRWKANNLGKLKPKKIDEEYLRELRRYLTSSSKDIRYVVWKFNSWSPEIVDLVKSLALSRNEDVSSRAAEKLYSRLITYSTASEENLEFSKKLMLKSYDKQVIRKALEYIIRFDYKEKKYEFDVDLAAHLLGRKYPPEKANDMLNVRLLGYHQGIGLRELTRPRSLSGNQDKPKVPSGSNPGSDK